MRLFVCGVGELRVAGVTRVLFGKKLDSSGRDSVLGEQCGSVADFVKGTNAKFANLPQNERSEVSLENPQSSHSPTAIPRILMEESQKQSEKARVLADKQTALESSSRAAQSGVAIHNQNADSSNAQSVFSQNAVRRQDFGDKNGALQGESRAHTRAYVTADSPQQSPFLAQKPTPESSKKPTPKAAKLASTIKTELRAFFKQFLPAMLGSSTAQIASFIDTILASFLASGAISYLYYANRIFQLPLAIFAIAISTALFPMVAKAIKANEHQKALIAMKKAFWFLLFMLLFCAVGGIMLREQIIWLLYEHGKFSRADTLKCAMVFAGYMVGLVPFGCARIFSLYLYSRSQQALAAKISAISLLVGVVFSLVLMQFLGAFGLALAGSLSGFVLFALTIRAFGFGEFWAIICARNYALLLGFMLVCEVLLFALWLHYIQIPH
ncbi:hypothetical protein F4V45_04420 [Helicobacter canis]|uniref:Virulence factor MviN n=2 Tax=Helicobacter canis TaxID=29419 RepID=A0A5M9QME8_9HELI|nr:hypothetical protein F4V45_04420 [Helicobacter canis]